MSKYRSGDILTGKRLGQDVRLISHLYVDGVKHWVFQKEFRGSDFKGGDVGVVGEGHIDAFYEKYSPDDQLTEGEVWLADHAVSGQINVFVARDVPEIGVRLWHAVRGTWSSRESWEGDCHLTNFRQATRNSGEKL